MRVVAALGGNALLRRGQRPTAEAQRANAKKAAAALAEIAAGHDLIVTHGNGPQVGLLALQSEAYGEVEPYPLDVLDAESEGMLGYVLEQELANAQRVRQVVSLLTQVVVDADDPAFAYPTKPVGPVFDAERAGELARKRAWAIARDGDGWRRVVPSPEPRRVVEIDAIAALTAGGFIVICAGGGGVPVTVGRDGRMQGSEAVIDKDLTAALLARELRADALLLLTDVTGVEENHGTGDARPIRHASPRALRALDLPAGSMGPKVEAASRFIEAGGGVAAIAALEDAAAALRGEAGTTVIREVAAVA